MYSVHIMVLHSQGVSEMKTKIVVDSIDICESNSVIETTLVAGERSWCFWFCAEIGVHIITEVESGKTIYKDFLEFTKDSIVCSSFDLYCYSGGFESFEFKIEHKESLSKLREKYASVKADDFRRPDASNFSPNPDRLKYLISKSGLSKAEIARKLGISERGLAFNLMDINLKNYRQMPYTSQFAIECLVPGMKFFKSFILLV